MIPHQSIHASPNNIVLKMACQNPLGPDFGNSVKTLVLNTNMTVTFKLKDDYAGFLLSDDAHLHKRLLKIGANIHFRDNNLKFSQNQ